jgi:hypothetical protein
MHARLGRMRHRDRPVVGVAAPGQGAEAGPRRQRRHQQRSTGVKATPAQLRRKAMPWNRSSHACVEHHSTIRCADRSIGTDCSRPPIKRIMEPITCGCGIRAIRGGWQTAKRCWLRRHPCAGRQDIRACDRAHALRLFALAGCRRIQWQCVSGRGYSMPHRGLIGSGAEVAPAFPYLQASYTRWFQRESSTIVILIPRRCWKPSRARFSRVHGSTVDLRCLARARVDLRALFAWLLAAAGPASCAEGGVLSTSISRTATCRSPGRQAPLR